MDAVKILGSLLGGGSMSSGLGGDVIGGLLKGAMGGGGSSSSLGAALGGGGERQSGLGNVLGAALAGERGGSGGGGGLAGILGTVAMAALAKYATGQGGGMPDLGALLGGGGNASGGLGLAQLDDADANAHAELLIEAMINAAKADGRIDAREERTILERLGDLDPDEAAFLREKVQAPLDARGFARRVPASMAREVYATSLLAMELDERSEAVYLRDLAQALALGADECNAIHREMGAPAIFR